LEAGWPTDSPWVAGLPLLGHRIFFGWLAGLAAAGPVELLDVALRVRPLLDVASLGLTALALGRALGAGLAGATIGALLLLLGGDLSQHAYALASLGGARPTQIEAWGFGTSFLLPFNPMAPGVQTVLAACLLLRRAVAARGA